MLVYALDLVLIMNDKLNHTAMFGALVDARMGIDRLITRINSGDLDDLESMAMSCEFEPILRQLCYAWHCKWMTQEEIDNGGQELHDKMCSLIPNWGLSFTLVDVDEPPEFDRRNARGHLSK